MRKSSLRPAICLLSGKLFLSSTQHKTVLVPSKKIPVLPTVDPNYPPTSAALQLQNTVKWILDSGYVLISRHNKLKIRATLFMILKSLGHSNTKCN